MATRKSLKNRLRRKRKQKSGFERKEHWLTDENCRFIEYAKMKDSCSTLSETLNMIISTYIQKSRKKYPKFKLDDES